MPARVHVFTLAGKARTHASRAYSSRARIWNETGTRREGGGKEKKAEGTRKRERKRQKVEENFDVRSYAIVWGEGAPGPLFPCAPKSPHCRFYLAIQLPDRSPLVTYTEAPFYSVSLSFYLLDIAREIREYRRQNWDIFFACGSNLQPAYILTNSSLW